ncbi:SDR family oxidoreductase, partial [Paenibacillus sepulcri]|nr:SDR family oxidoreductase [Paenibacillus sepulcri]
RRESMDKRQQDSRIRQSGLSWTIVEPPTLTDGPRTGRYRLDTARAPMLGRVSRADVADFMLDQLDSHEFNNKSTVIY